jgi:hypothetical protein
MNIGERFEAACADNPALRPLRTIADVVVVLAWDAKADTRDGDAGRWGWFAKLGAAVFVPCSEHEAEATIVAHIMAKNHAGSIGDVLDVLLPEGV